MHDPRITTTLEGLYTMLAHAERKLANARPVDVAGGSPTANRDSAQRNVDRLRASIARLEAQR